MTAKVIALRRRAARTPVARASTLGRGEATELLRRAWSDGEYEILWRTAADVAALPVLDDLPADDRAELLRVLRAARCKVKSVAGQVRIGKALLDPILAPLETAVFWLEVGKPRALN